MKLKKQSQIVITISSHHIRVIEGNYLELHKQQKDSDLHYVDYHKTAMILAFTVIGNCPMPEIINEKKNRKLVAMYVISSDIHQTLCELVCADDN